MATEIEVIIDDMHNALCRATERLREAKVIPLPPPRKCWTNLDEAKSWVRNALAYGAGNMRPEHKISTLVANLEKIQKLLENPHEPNHEGPHK